MQMTQDWAILVVDDDPFCREMLTYVLGERGYHVTAATDGMNALAQVRTSRPDLVIADLQMPGVGGQTLIRELKKRDRTIPVVILSASEEPLGLDDPVDGFMAKPFDLQELLDTAQRFCPRVR